MLRVRWRMSDRACSSRAARPTRWWRWFSRGMASRSSPRMPRSLAPASEPCRLSTGGCQSADGWASPGTRGDSWLRTPSGSSRNCWSTPGACTLAGISPGERRRSPRHGPRSPASMRLQAASLGAVTSGLCRCCQERRYVLRIGSANFNTDGRQRCVRDRRCAEPDVLPGSDRMRGDSAGEIGSPTASPGGSRPRPSE